MSGLEDCIKLVRFRAKREHQLKRFEGMLPESPGQNLVLTVLYVSYSLDSGRRKTLKMKVLTRRNAWDTAGPHEYPSLVRTTAATPRTEICRSNNTCSSWWRRQKLRQNRELTGTPEIQLAQIPVSYLHHICHTPHCNLPSEQNLFQIGGGGRN